MNVNYIYREQVSASVKLLLGCCRTKGREGGVNKLQ